MLTIKVPDQEQYDSKTKQFISKPGGTLLLEHSLLSLYKWEKIWEVPFLDGKPKTADQYLSYIKCMTISSVSDESIYFQLTPENIKEIDTYIGRKMTATTFTDAANNAKSRIKGEQITAELLYYYMFSFGIPKECEKWHLSSLTTLIKVFAVKQEKPKNMSRRQELAQRQSLNAARRARLHSKG